MIEIIDAYANWCVPCQRILKILPNLERQLEGKATIRKVDMEANPSLKEEWKVAKIPTFLVFKDGVEVHRFEGIHPLAEIQQYVEQLYTTSQEG